MRRVVLAVSGLVAATTLLISLKSAPGATRTPDEVAAYEAALARRAAEALASASPGVSGGPPAATPSAGAGPSTVVLPSGTAPPPANPPAGPAASTPPKTLPPAPPPGGGPVVGDSSFTEFGYVTVGIVVSGGRIVDVVAVEMPADEARSVTISQRAAPQLRERALAAQGTAFDTVSGATWTSNAFKHSLASAMQKAGLA